jgi:hypothetical protein
VAWATPRSLERRAATLRGLLERIRCYEIGIDRTQGVEPVVEAVLEYTRNGSRT